MGDIFASGGVSSYPTDLDTRTAQVDATPTLTFSTSAAMASKANELADAVIAVQTAVGISTVYGTGYRAQGILCLNNAATPDSQFDMDADYIVLRPDTYGTDSPISVLRMDPGAALTNNILTSGPAAGGRDQSGAFSASSWVHFYWIWNGTTLSTTSSATAPPTGPAMPTGYTHWAYAAAVRHNASSVLEKVRVVGNHVWYEDGFSTFRALSAGSATTETAVAVSVYIPPNALDGIYQIFAQGTDAAANVRSDIKVRWQTARDFIVEVLTSQAANITFSTFGEFFIPNLSQNLYYLWTDANIDTRAAYIDVMGYTVPNGE